VCRGGKLLMKIDPTDLAMWTFCAALYAFSCSLFLGISFALVCAPWPVKIVFIPLWIATLGMFMFLSIMFGQRLLEEESIRQILRRLRCGNRL
jgi:hypothetical protein